MVLLLAVTCNYEEKRDGGLSVLESFVSVCRELEGTRHIVFARGVLS